MMSTQNFDPYSPQPFRTYIDSNERLEDLRYILLGMDQELARVFPGVDFRVQFVRGGPNTATVKAPPLIHSFLHQLLDQFETPSNQVEDREVAFAVAACKSRENHCLLEYAKHRPLTERELLALRSRNSILHEFYPEQRYTPRPRLPQARGGARVRGPR